MAVVVIADDNERILAVMTRSLQRAGHTVIPASDGELAWERIREHRPDLAILDGVMPGTDGFELILRVRALTDSRERTIPAAALTAYARSEDRVRTLRAGFQVHLAKPIDPEELVAAISDLARHVPTS